MFHKEHFLIFFYTEDEFVLKKTEIAALKKCPLFPEAEDALIKELLCTKKYNTACFDKGEEIFSPDSYKRCLAIILKGSADVLKCNEKDELYMSTLKEGNVFGMSSVFYEGDSFPTTVRAKENVRILYITKEQLISLFTGYPFILGNFLRILSNKIHFLNEKIESISAPDAVAALKAYLYDTAAKIGNNSFSLPVSCSTLASMLGIGRTSLYMSFHELEKNGVITKNGKNITITERM